MQNVSCKTKKSRKYTKLWKVSSKYSWNLEKKNEISVLMAFFFGKYVKFWTLIQIVLQDLLRKKAVSVVTVFFNTKKT